MGFSFKDTIFPVLDIFATPRRYFFEQLSHFVTRAGDDEKSKRDAEEVVEKLKELGSIEGIQNGLFDEYCVREKRSYYDVFCEFPLARRVPLEYLLEMIPFFYVR